MKAEVPRYIMTRCLFCGAYCEVKCGVYCESYSGNTEEKEHTEDANILGCTQIGTSYICDSCLKDLKEALGLL
ncbi:hypothetical protein [Methanosarcina mazei]|uniref:Uncharacterized protein n=4 Tax=Methanosarcina mazei TaxID=2209 RepID=M1Q913_METMZ|nr:hypothetical protein [Methanosarcina mazei]AGF96693.1 Hypothetical protein MmTuc01_1313 [Methanosarcina mazei Tuc01]AKB60035.1 hypothetical protein MSMAP_0050 [Methanosarcina mazei SarPi]WIM44492.1 hypothetical protein PSF70_06725 [Methanosarcina mazei]BBL66182.1 hypothetical protein MmazTMA_31590 [Methanosarcina mazei]